MSCYNLPYVIRDRGNDDFRCERHTAVIQNGNHHVTRYSYFDREQRAKLRIAILFDNKHGRMRIDEILHRLVEWECLDAHVVHRESLFAQAIDSFEHSRIATAYGNNSNLRVRL